MTAKSSQAFRGRKVPPPSIICISFGPLGQARHWILLEQLAVFRAKQDESKNVAIGSTTRGGRGKVVDSCLLAADVVANLPACLLAIETARRSIHNISRYRPAVESYQSARNHSIAKILVAIGSLRLLEFFSISLFAHHIFPQDPIRAATPTSSSGAGKRNEGKTKRIFRCRVVLKSAWLTGFPNGGWLAGRLPARPLSVVPSSFCSRRHCSRKRKRRAGETSVTTINRRGAQLTRARRPIVSTKEMDRRMELIGGSDLRAAGSPLPEASICTLSENAAIESN